MGVSIKVVESSETGSKAGGERRVTSKTED